MKALIAGNWKMNLNLNEAIELVEKLKNSCSNARDDILICPSFVYLQKVGELIKDSNILLGAQNMYFEKKGAFTGEVSAQMLVDMGVKYVICGHSERRNIFNENDEIVYKKVFSALQNDLIPILCVGENLTERENNVYLEKVRNQIEYIFKKINFENNSESAGRIVIAYEPIWAIGTGKNALPKDAFLMHKTIRATLQEIVGSVFANSIRIIYGGSVNPENIDDLMNVSQIDGVLVGGASLSFESFNRIINYKVTQC
ncbi:MAG: triose-phosphate isomerase [Spirochaetes bacterium]|nr:triose-phosphate isomerase [Spirochaetota bacterium]NLJ05493.1 triose-phosphate isomerase [Exilispira sp.]HNV43985.1 triose-phosphate isomerase [Exilispira sp.]HOV46493.1 triose-phosphate isomerase [Exilispira sp.]